MEKWMIMFILAAGILISVYAINEIGRKQSTNEVITNQDYIIQEIEKLVVTRENNTKKILDNMSQGILSTKHDASVNRQILEAIIKNLNVTVTLEPNDTKVLEQGGKISGVGKPQIVQ